MARVYHGCDPDFVEKLLRGEISINEWQLSENPYDWLGHGIYFWEYGPERARTWAEKGGVVGAVIQLGLCLDLTDVSHTARLVSPFESIRQEFARAGTPLPENRGKRRDLDCLVINSAVRVAKEAGIIFQTVRCPFLEGEPAFPGSAILRESHVQIAVRDKSCILGVFRPNVV